jgi:hypothetical protein
MKKCGRPCKYDVRSSITFVTTPEAKKAFEEECFHEGKTMSDILHGNIQEKKLKQLQLVIQKIMVI